MYLVKRLAIAVLVVSALFALEGKANAADPKPSIVLVHGAWADGSSWSKVMTLLQKDGYTVTSVQNPETTFAEDVAATRRALAAQTGPTVLVGHSYAGAVITEAAADAANVISLVYVAAFGLDVGESLDAIAKSGPPPESAKYIKEAGGYLLIDPVAFPKYFCPDVDAVTARWVAAAQVPISLDCWNGKITKAAWKTKPSYFIVATNDQMIPPAAERMFAKRMGAVTIEIPSSHAVMLSHPKEVAAFIEKATKPAAKQ
jgi:pimeloyl-ACP methyl ester carboxylesterase